MAKKQARLPAKWSRQLLKLQHEFTTALKTHGVTPDFLVKDVILPLLQAKRGGKSNTIDSRAARVGLEMSLHLLGLWQPIGMELPDTKGTDNVVTGEAITALTGEMLETGKSITEVNKYLFETDEGVAAVVKRREEIIKANAEVEDDVGAPRDTAGA